MGLVMLVPAQEVVLVPVPRWWTMINKRVGNPAELWRGTRPVLTHVGRSSSATYRPQLVVSAPAAVVLQAVVFGTLHVVGFPAGVVGVALAFVYGLALGVIRVLTGGLRLAVVAHIAANATIAALVVSLLVPE